MNYLHNLTLEELIQRYRWEQMRINPEDRKLSLANIRAEINERLDTIDAIGREDRIKYNLER